MDFETRIGKAKIKSVGKHIKISYNGETIKLNKRKLKKLFIKVATVCICIHFFGHALDYTIEKIDYLFDVVSVRAEESRQAEQNLLVHNLNTEPNENGQWNNDYSKLNRVSKEDLYGILNYCGYSEAENVLKSLGYSSWHNYLAKNGYYDSEGRPSLQVWENYMESNLVTQRNEAKQNGRIY